MSAVGPGGQGLPNGRPYPPAPRPVTAIGLVLFPFSWHVGVWERPHKTLWSFGPFRFVVYRTTGSWGGQ